MSKNCVSEHFSKVGCRNIYAAVARNTFGSENVENVKNCGPRSTFHRLDVASTFHRSDLAKLRCGDKHVSQHCTPLWQKAHLEVKM